MLFGVAGYAADDYGHAENVSSKPILGVTLPLWMGIGGMLAGLVLMTVSRPFFKDIFSRKLETCSRGRSRSLWSTRWFGLKIHGIAWRSLMALEHHHSKDVAYNVINCLMNRLASEFSSGACHALFWGISLYQTSRRLSAWMGTEHEPAVG